MAALSEARVAELLAPYVTGSFARNGTNGSSPELYRQIITYVSLLQRWNQRTNLTSIREPEQIVRRHFGESLFAGVYLQERLASGATILDIGSGAGFPGLPIQMLLPGTRVTLAESQGKKVAFLREVVRTLGLPATVWAGRVEDLPPTRRFDAVTLRAVERMDIASEHARERVQPGGLLVLIVGAASVTSPTHLKIPASDSGFLSVEQI